MNIEKLNYPWQEDLENLSIDLQKIIRDLIFKVDTLEIRIQELERFSPQEYVTITNGTSTGSGFVKKGPFSVKK